MKNQTRKTKEPKGITLIALIITIIVLIILTAVSINVLTGENGIINKAINSKEATRGAEVKETVILAATNNAQVNYVGESKKSRTEVIEELSEAKKLTTEEVSKLTDQENPVDIITIGGIEIDFSILVSNVVTIGEAYEDSWIGRQITYTSDNGEKDWIIIGTQKNSEGKNDILITTANATGNYTVYSTLTDWCDYEKNINNACAEYIGKIGKNNITVKEARSITLEDINNITGFSDKFKEYTFGEVKNFDEQKVNYCYPDESNKTWIKPTVAKTSKKYKNNSYYYYYKVDNEKYYYWSENTNWTEKDISTLGITIKENNIKYIFANNNPYWVASSSVHIDNYWANFIVSFVAEEGVSCGGLCWSDANAGYDHSGSNSMALRPVVVLSSEIPKNDLEIGELWKYDNSD